MKILICDDEIFIRILIRKVLEKEGFLICESTNGLEGYEKALSVKPDLIIMDYEMPIMNGAEAIKKIKDNCEIADIPVILLTGYNLEPELKESLMEHADSYLVKPFEKEELFSAIKRAVGKNPDKPSNQ